LVELLARAAYAELMRPPVAEQELIPAGEVKKARGVSKKKPGHMDRVNRIRHANLP
jgi:hypothetical protein